MATVTTYVSTAGSEVFISARLNDMVKCKYKHISARLNHKAKYRNENISARTMQESSCADHVSHSTILFGKTITVPFSVTKTAFVAIAYFSASCYRYREFSFTDNVLDYGMVSYTVAF